MAFLALTMVLICLSSTTVSFHHFVRPTLLHQASRNSLGSRHFFQYYSRHYLIPPSASDCITSTKSNTVKKIKNLLNKRKKRNEVGQVVVEGPRIVIDLLRSQQTAGLVRQILVDCDKYEECYATELQSVLVSTSNEHAGKEGDLLLLGPKRRPPEILLATPQVLQSCTDTVTNQGIVALVDIPDYVRQEILLEQLLLSNSNASTPLLYLVLDAVSDPGNLGALIRSARATGVAAVLLLPGSVDPFNPKAIRAAMGTTFSLPVLQMDTWQECCRFLHQVGCKQIWAATMLQETKNGGDDDGISYSRNKDHYRVDWMSESATALVIGNEGNGLTLPLRTSVQEGHVVVADDSDEDDSINKNISNSKRIPINAVHVPMQAGVESLNAAVCGSVILFEYQRQVTAMRPR